MSAYLQDGLPSPVANNLDAPFWKGLQDNRLLIQRCANCSNWQWGPEWICHHCHSFELDFEETKASGVIYSYERVWHPVHPALASQGPYLIVLVALPAAGAVRLVGNLLGDPRQDVEIGGRVEGVFEHHLDAESNYSLLQWQNIPLE